MKLHEFPPNILALITAYLEYDTALALIHLSGDVILRHKVEVQDGLTDITITKKKSLFLFFRRCCPTGLKPRTLNIRLLDESPPGLDFPTLLAPSLLEICIEWRFGPELFFRPWKPEIQIASLLSLLMWSMCFRKGPRCCIS